MSPTRSSLPSATSSSLGPGLRLPAPEVCLRAIPQGAPQSERAALGEAGGEPGAGEGGGWGCPSYKAWPPPAATRTAGTPGGRTGGHGSELGPCRLRDLKRSIPPGPERGREGAQARGMLGSVKMEAHDLAEWSYYPEAGEVCPRGWRSGKWGAGIRVRA